MSANIHEHPEEWLAATLADGLAPEERRALDEHLAGCEPCRALQADLSALDETLRRDFPAAVGPAAGFEARLVAGFRRRHGRGGERLAGLRMLVGWLLRQRGVQFAGVAAALVALVGIGQMVTRRTATAPAIIGEQPPSPPPEVDELVTAVEAPPGVVAAEGRYGFAEKNVVEDKRKSTDYKDSPEIFLGSVPDPVFNRDHAAHAAAGSLSLGAGSSSITSLLDSKTDQSRSLFMGEGATYTAGATVITAGGTLAMSSPSISGNATTKDKNIRRTEEPAPAPASAPQGTPGVVRDTGPAPETASTPVADVRKLIRNATATVEVASFDQAVDAITAAATSNGGFLATRDSTRGDNGKVSGTLVCKVLPEHLDRFLAGLRTLGSLEDQTIQTDDVTSEYFDTDARLRNARRMEDRLLKMLGEVKGKMSEVLQVEKEIGRVRADIESMQGRLKLYDAQVKYATVTLNVHEKDLGQPATFLLHETATLALLAADVEKTATEARRIAEAVHAQVLSSKLSRDSSGQTRATLNLSITPEAAAEVIAQTKALGRIENFHLQDDRTAQNGNPSEDAGEAAAKVERAPVAFDVTISHDEQVSRQVRFTLVAADAEGAFEKARAAALAAGAEIVNANVAHTQDGHANASLAVRVPPAAEAGLLAALRELGRAGEAETRRVASGADVGAGPVLIQLSVVDVEPAVQETSVQVQTAEVERRADEIKRDAAAAHATVEGSSFSGESDGRQRAGLKFRLPLGAYPGFIERVRSLGTVKEFTVRREDRPEKTPGAGSDASAPVVVELSLYSEGPVVNANSGLAATLRRTFGQGAGALTWSVQMIGVAVAFLVPWAVLLAVVVAGVRWWQRRRSRRTPQDKESPGQ